MNLKSNIIRTLCLGGSILVAAAASADNLPERVPAFPGAEGFGKYTTGGRGGHVYTVTSLEDSGVGTLRWANDQPGPRTIVFAVSGTIHLKSSLKLKENTTIAGQTAPGDGICLADYPVTIASNSIVRYIRFRLGNTNVTQNGADGWDGLSVMDSHDVIVDHCSVSWSIDECCSILGNKNTTLQWSIVAQSLVNAGHSKGAHGYGGNWGGSGASFHHNLVVHHGSRTPRLGPRPTTQLDERMDMRNNVIYNFGGNGCYGGEGMNVNIVNNYYKPGPGSPTNTRGKRIAGIGVRTNSYCTTYPDYAPALHLWGTYFVEGNVNSKYSDVTADNWANGMYNQIDTSNSATDGTWNNEVKKNIRRSDPVPYYATTTHSADDAYKRVLDYAGCSLSRDNFDDQMVGDCRVGTATATGKGLSKGFVNSQDDNENLIKANGGSAWPILNSTEAPVDTDGDGIPDEWEKANGLDPEKKGDANLYNAEGYTMLEVYLASLVEDITEGQNAGGDIEGDILAVDPVKDSYTISLETSTGGTSSWTGEFAGGIRLFNIDGKSISIYRKTHMGIARGVQHYILLPAGSEVTAIDFAGKGNTYPNRTTEPSLVELNGESFDSGTYKLPTNQSTADGKFTVELTQPAKGMLTLTFADCDPILSGITLHTRTASTSGIDDIVVSDEDPRSQDPNWYTLSGLNLGTERPTTAGIYINRGRKIAVR